MYFEAANLRIYANKAALELWNALLAVRDKFGAELGKDEETYVGVPGHVEISVTDAVVDKAKSKFQILQL